jgi:hypothetical protein
MFAHTYALDLLATCAQSPGLRSEGEMMKLRYSISMAALAVASAISAVPALAAAPSRPVSGTMGGSASGVESFCTTGTFSVSGSFDASFIGRGTYTGTITSNSCIPAPACCGIPSAPYPVEGTFLFAGPGGSFTASGSGSGISTISAHNDFYDIQLGLTIQSGTRRYQRAAGSFDLALFADAFLQTGTDTASGTITGSLTPSGGA